MYSLLVSEHIEVMKGICGENSTVLIYKGFPLKFVQEIQKTFTSLSQSNILLEDNSLNLEAIKTNSLDYLSSIQNLKDNHGVMLFEEFLIFSLNINPSLVKKQFIIINNNFFQYYPNQSNHQYVDLEKAIDSEKEILNDEIFNEFYSDSAMFGTIKHIQYPDIEEKPNVHQMDFFYTEEEKLISSLFTDEMDTTGFIQFQLKNTSWQNLKYQIFSGLQITQPINLLLDTAALKDKRSLQELLILQKIFTAARIKFEFCIRKDFYSDYVRPELLEILDEYWHSQSFRNLKVYEDPDVNTTLVELSQGAVCEYVIKQCEVIMKNKLHEDIFLTAPTGAGKSVLFQIPAIYLAEKYNLVTIVISPLKALMLDQVTGLKVDKGYRKVGFINSDISLIEREDVLNNIKAGNISIVYLSPELLLSYDIKYFVGERQLGLLVIDEAHLVTTWGRDFRVDYWFLGNYIRKARKYLSVPFPVFAVTATAVYNGPNDMVFDTINSLNMQNCRKFIGYVRRDEISFDIRGFKLPSNSHENDKIYKTASVIGLFLKNKRKAIIYFPWISTINDVVRLLTSNEKQQIGEYHSRADVEVRNSILSDFKTGRISIVLATKAFGMGVDISDITEVYHHATSGTIADYVQEIGRVARSSEIKGIASMDFHPNDLKYTRILQGLNSLKQWQVKLVLEKLNNIYQLNKERNFLVSIDDFAHIFPDSKDPEQNVKSALLVLEKDLLDSFKYNVLIVRPKSLFSTVFARVKNNEKSEFIHQFGAFITEEIGTNWTLSQKVNSNTTLVPNTNTQTSVFKVRLDKIWTNKYANEGFPEIKRKFFNKQLFSKFTNISPQLRLNILFHQDIDATKYKLTKMFETLENVISSFSGSYFTKDKLSTELNVQLKNTSLSRNLSNLLISMYSDNRNDSVSDILSSLESAFIQKRLNQSKGQDEYRVINTTFDKVKHQSRQRFQRLFGSSNEKEQVKYISANVNKNREIIRLAYIMEVFGLCTYEIIGGEKPQIFIRINDPLKITRLAKSRNYENKVIRGVEKKFQMNVNLMTHFFQNPMTNGERWQFIEDYFLGKSEEELIQT